MKKIPQVKPSVLVLVLLSVIAMLCCSCNATDSDYIVTAPKVSDTEPSDQGDMTPESTGRSFYYDEGVYYSKPWSPSDIAQINGTGTNLNLDQSAAIKIANAEFEKMQQEGYFYDMVLCGIFYDIEDEVWIVWYGPEILIPGDCFEIAVSQRTGEIIDMWPGE